MKKFGSSIERVEGVREEEKKEKIFADYREIFSNQEFKGLKDAEREKTADEIKIINLVNETTNWMRNHFGLENFDVPAKNVHIIKEEGWVKHEGEKHSAVHRMRNQAVGIREQPANISFLVKTLHEIIHFKSYHAVQETVGEKNYVDAYRVGIKCVTRNGEEAYLTNLNEAVTELLTKDLFKIIIKENPQTFVSDMGQTKKAIEEYTKTADESERKFFNSEVYFAKDLTVGEKWYRALGRKIFGGKKERKVITEEFSYSRQRNNLVLLMNKIFERNRDKFKDKVDVFDVFIKAMLDGNIMPLGRLLEKTFKRPGLHLILSKLAELDSDIEKQREFIESL